MQTFFSMTRKQIRFAHRQRGASLLEGIAYLGIAAIIILGAIALLTGALSNSQTNRMIQETTAIRTATSKLYMGQGYGTTSLNVSLVAAKVFPTTLAQTAAGVVTNAWGGGVTVTGATSTYVLAYASVPQDVCINTLTGLTGWVQVDVNSNTFTTFPITPAAAATACPAGSTTISMTAA